MSGGIVVGPRELAIGLPRVLTLAAEVSLLFNMACQNTPWSSTFAYDELAWPLLSLACFATTPPSTYMVVAPRNVDSGAGFPVQS